MPNIIYKDKYLSNDESFATKAVHAGNNPETNCQYGGLAPPLIMSSTFMQNVPPGGFKVKAYYI